MSGAAEDVAPPTSRSGDVQLKSKEDMAAWQPITARVPVFRVAQWLQQVEAGKLDMGPGATAIHGLLMVMIAQHQGYNAMCEATARALGKAALTSESAARDALAELVKAAWLLRHDRKRSDNQWVEALYSVATEPGRPIPSRAPKKRGSVPSSGTPVPANEGPVPSSGTPMVAGSTATDTDGVPPGGVPCTARRGALYRQAGCPVPPEPNKKTIQEITEKISEKTIAGVPASAHTCEATTMPTATPATEFRLTGEPDPKPRAKAAPRAPKPKKEPPPKPPPSPVTLLRDCWFTQWAAAKMPGIGPWDAVAATAAKTYLDLPGATVETAKEVLIGMLRTPAGDWHRTEEQGRYATVHAALMGKHTVPFAAAGKRWLAEQEAAALPPREIPPPVPIPEMFQAMARADAAAGRVHPLVQHFENLRKSKET